MLKVEKVDERELPLAHLLFFENRITPRMFQDNLLKPHAAASGLP